ncbi:hypothetical protein RGQ29_031975 [Quercus rubra]|uniref:3-hydroxyisobutyryl-CoA hydrolase n=1 Tax=Quercus rubra TaxID=3512 RepID=A0AAN7DTF7_QUERU|nr:hypothetical protein RGQ29_031975 [Quercus rubra]
MMQRFKAALLQRRNNLHIHGLRFLNQFQTRNLCSLPDTNITDELDNQVLVEGKAWSRTAILNRPSVLNCLSTAMGSGRAFCAGGDIVTLYHMINAGKMEDCKEFFRMLYTYIYILGTYLKPHVALLNGITMGGGAGVSIPGMFRVATDKTRFFATSETLIGFHPDAGASFSSHIYWSPGPLEINQITQDFHRNGVNVGIKCICKIFLFWKYAFSSLEVHRGSWFSNGSTLGLTGQNLMEQNWISLWLDTHYAHSSDTDDPFCHCETSLEKYSDLVYLDKIEILDKCFSMTQLKKLSDALIREGRFQNLDQCLIRGGVRARMVDKDLAPKWNPPSLEQVSKDMVEHYFSPLSKSEPDLELPTELREAFT